MLVGDVSNPASFIVPHEERQWGNWMPYYRATRQAQGLHIAALATQLKVTPSKLELLESDQHAELQGSTFVRALAQAACRALKIDPAPVLARLPDAHGNTLDQVNGGLNAPFREHGARRAARECPQ